MTEEVKKVETVAVEPTNTAKIADPKVIPKLKIISLDEYKKINGIIVGNKKPVIKKIKVSAIKLKELKEKPLNMFSRLDKQDDPYLNNQDVHKPQPNSIHEILKDIHPDIQKFFTLNTIVGFKTSCHTLTLKLSNGLTITADSMNDNRKKYKIMNRKAVLLERIG